ncbi:unnamed protein product [Lupinus luteus]|uniref:STAS domain-containing protein n=1 Tax=Lupinus luteus TaxID=3873 RepID=A0AAV1YKZ6_LUPLU
MATGDTLPLIHKVGLPPKQTLFEEIKHNMKEIFFSDNPLSKFKNQSGSRKFVLGLQSVFPIFDWGRSYNLITLRDDFIAGLTIASLCIPQDIAYASLANLDPQYGLYTSFVTPLVYAFMGSSRDIAVGPVSVVSLLLGTMLTDEISDYKSHEYLRLAFTATFFAGITQLALGLLRLGFLIDFISHAAIMGFMSGAAITIALQQLKGLLGIQNFTKKTDIVSVMRSVWSTVHDGSKKNKKLFWMAAIAPMISVILSTFFVYITRADKKGVSIVRHIKKGVNPSSASEIFFSGKYLGPGIRIGVIAGLVALTEAAAIGRTFAVIKDYSLDGNKEMLAMGTMNIVGSLTSCYLATGSFSRTAVNFMAGCKTAVSNIVMSIVVLLTLILITPLFKYTPNAVLSSIIIVVVLGFVNIDVVLLLWKIDKFDFLACMGAFFAVTDIDTSGIHAFQELYKSLQKREVQLVLANPGPIVMEKLHASKLTELIGEHKIFLSVTDAVATFGTKGEEL